MEDGEQVRGGYRGGLPASEVRPPAGLPEMDALVSRDTEDIVIHVYNRDDGIVKFTIRFQDDVPPVVGHTGLVEITSITQEVVNYGKDQ